MPITPFAEVPQLLHFRVGVLDIAFYGEADEVVEADVAADAEWDASGFVGEEAGVGSGCGQLLLPVVPSRISL